MTKMSIEEKAKAYDEALERFKAFKKKYYTKNTVIGDAIFDKTGEMQRDFESIFPELRESEDERMMREFNDWLCEEIECRTNDLRDEKDRRTLNMLCYVLTKVKDWLEKQKEPENVSASTIIPSCWECEQKEQKPKEPGYKHEDYFCERYQANAFNAGRESVLKEQKPAEWSEEDEEIINEVASILINDENRADNKREEDRLAYLAERIQSLRLQSHWKPSDEQMKALKQVVFYYGDSWVSKIQQVLGTLYEQLKELM